MQNIVQMQLWPLSINRILKRPGHSSPERGPAIERAAGSTDMGNVSLVLPSLHPFIGIDSLPAVNHQPKFTTHCITESANKALIYRALAMAWTAIGMATDIQTRERLIRQDS